MNELVQEAEMIIGRMLSPKEYTILMDLAKSYTTVDILHFIEWSKFETRPIDYARKIIIDKCTKKDAASGSEWLDKFKESL